MEASNPLYRKGKGCLGNLKLRRSALKKGITSASASSMPSLLQSRPLQTGQLHVISWPVFLVLVAQDILASPSISLLPGLAQSGIPSNR